MVRTISTGNTILTPPRLSGDAAQDSATIQRYLQDLYDGLVKAANIIGATADLERRVTALEQRVTALEP